VPPFSIAGKQLASTMTATCSPMPLRLIKGDEPRAVLLENVPGLASAKFAQYRQKLFSTLSRLGYETTWRVVQAADYGVPQLRPRFILVGVVEGTLTLFGVA